MNIEKCPNEFEKIKKYKLPPENIIPLDQNSEIRKRNKSYFRGLLDEGIDWPVEIQGGGESDFKKKEFKIHYPQGDLFLSFAVAIHELGHLRQGEISEKFADKVLGAPEPKISKDDLNQKETKETEADAWGRGLERAKKYCPEVLEFIEQKFQQYKEQGKFQEFNNFESFFQYVVSVELKITEFVDKIESSGKMNKRANGRLIGKMIIEDELTNKFFTEQNAWRTGEIIDKEMIENFIKKAAPIVAEEKH